jgi:hypothetical protein
LHLIFLEMFVPSLSWQITIFHKLGAAAEAAANAPAAAALGASIRSTGS